MIICSMPGCQTTAGCQCGRMQVFDAQSDRHQRLSGEAQEGQMTDLADRITVANFHYFREIGDVYGWTARIREEVTALSAKLAEAERERDEARLLVTEANNSLFGSQSYFHSLTGGEFNKYHLAKAIEDLKSDARRYHLAKARVAVLEEALEPFVAFARDNTDEHGWAGLRCEGERIRDWFGPSEFRATLSATKEPKP